MHPLLSRDGATLLSEIADDLAGQIPVAAVEVSLDVHLDINTLLAHCRDALPRYAVPHQLWLCTDDAIPRTASGKVIRHRLAELLATDASDVAMRANGMVTPPIAPLATTL